MKLRDFLGMSRGFWNFIRSLDNLSLKVVVRDDALLGRGIVCVIACILDADNAFE